MELAMSSRSLVRLILGACCLCLASTVARADSPSVTAVLTESETSVGQPVQLQIQITGASNPKPPGEISVDGLEIQSAGVSRQYQMQNFSVSYSFTYNYMVVPTRAGAFKIPPLKIDGGGGKTLQTPELTLNVAGQSGRETQSANGRSRIGFLEMILPKSTAYVGEMIPLQTRIGINTRTPVASPGEDGMQIPGQGFTIQRANQQARNTIEEINGSTYNVVIENTAVSPVRSGKIEIGPAVIKPVVLIPTRQRNPNLPRDMLDDPFFNSFFNDPAFAPSSPRPVELKSEPATLDVKPLPPHPPAGFSGAVGIFSLKVEANPKKAQVGDPITVKASITGRGNFDRVTVPTLENDSGWHGYPPSDSFKQDDDVGISGTKTFEIVLSAKERKDKLPALSFTFFDPLKEAYVTLKSDEIPLQIEGGAAPAATPTSATAASTPANSAPPTPRPTPREQDILYQLTDRPATAQSFAPIYMKRSFWLAQALPLLALLGFIGWRLRQARLADRSAQRLARLQQEAAELQRGLRRNGFTPREYLANAARTVQVKTALARELDPNQVDAATAASVFHLDEERRGRLRELFHESDELRYSGTGNGEKSFSPEKRREILELIENLRA